MVVWWREVELFFCVLQGCIDQVESLVYFNSESKVIQQWDTQIHAVCTQLGGILEDCIQRGITSA